MPGNYIDANPYPWPHDGNLHPNETALLIIDMQREFCDASGYVASMGYDLTPLGEIVPRIAAVRNVIANWGGLIIHTREGHRPDLSDLSGFKAWRARRAGVEIGGTGRLGRVLVRGEEGWQIVPELAPRRGEITIDKSGYSAFSGTDLDRVLNVNGIKRLIFTGVTTDVCVHSTLRCAVDRGYECLLIEDACAATMPMHHSAAVGTITTEGGIFGAVTEADVLCRALGAS